MILTDDKLLRMVSEPLSLEEAPSLLARLESELAASGRAGRPGIGLSAPQIGVLRRAAIIRVPAQNSPTLLKVDLVNPKIVGKYNQMIFDGEGCLSFPKLQEKTYRFQEIIVENDIAPKKFIATGLFAVCIQHEIDHLDGKILPDIAIPKPNIKTLNLDLLSSKLLKL